MDAAMTDSAEVCEVPWRIGAAGATALEMVGVVPFPTASLEPEAEDEVGLALASGALPDNALAKLIHAAPA
jgi:hypothetical protein